MYIFIYIYSIWYKETYWGGIHTYIHINMHTQFALLYVNICAYIMFLPWLVAQLVGGPSVSLSVLNCKFKGRIYMFVFCGG